MSYRRDIRFRAYVTFTALMLFGVAIIIRILYIQFVKGDELREMSAKAHTKTEILDAQRGNIISADGQLLSSTKPLFDIRIDFKSINKDTFYTHVDKLAESLSNLFGDKTPSVYRKELETAFLEEKRYYLLKKDVQYYEFQELRTFPIFNKGPRRGGFIAENKPKRENPYGIYGYRTIGLWRKNASSVGLEKSYDEFLAGKEGSRVLRKTTGNTWIPVRGSELEPENGKDVVSTIDIKIQEIAEKALLETLETHKCQWGTVIVMEVETGQIKALANLGRQSDGTYWEDKNYALEANEPGSTFKLMSLLALIDEGHVTINDNVNVEGGVKKFGPQTIRDDHKGYGTLTIKNAFAKSSNVAFAKLVNQYFKDDPMRYIQRLQSLHLDKKTGIDILGEGTPLIKTVNSKSWNKVTSLPWIAYGYESLITPLHTCMVYNAVANKGRLMKPYLVSEIREYGNVVKKFDPVVLNPSIAKPETLKQLKECMREVVISGTGKRVQSQYYNAAGKTGTAQVAGMFNGKFYPYSAGIKQGSFVGFFPYEKPKYTIAVLVRSTPGGAYYGGVVAAPVFKTIADKLFAMHIGGWPVPDDRPSKGKMEHIKKSIPFAYNIAFRNKGLHASEHVDLLSIGQAHVTADKTVKVDYQSISGDKVPDVKGMGLRDAVYILESLGLKVEVEGFGRVVEQSIPAGENVINHKSIVIKLA